MFLQIQVYCNSYISLINIDLHYYDLYLLYVYLLLKKKWGGLLADSVLVTARKIFGSQTRLLSCNREKYSIHGFARITT